MTSDDLAVRIEGVLRSSERSLTIQEMAAPLGVSAHDVDRVVWSRPDRFVWQPGHRWALGIEKARPRADRADMQQPDARTAPLGARGSTQLRALTLASGVVLTVSRRPLDTHAFFMVKSKGNVVELVLNSAHELFSELPMPFTADDDGEGFKQLTEVLLEAWALYEDSTPTGPSRRASEDIRFLWGRRTAELLRESARAG